ncbi:AsmA family protein [Hymenobacter terrestris]|uniref:AsmA-like C-terminal domain-containing protein n=1 Tax=Hymenobacter terrestris TaxID=2748310 RepID=A0ABX2Q7P1_9BACT|nr:hypothetical protein [Hymenobacter terrestris]NVO86456.1 hypothetical protein [Hymenobacter terrestris]
MPETLDTASSFANPAIPRGKPTPPSRHWGRWLLLALLALLVALVLVGPHYLDLWLHRKLEQQVTAQTHGQYRLQVGELRTNLWQRAVRLTHVRLRPAATLADTLPRVRVDVAQLHVTGIGLLTLLRKGLVPIDSIVVSSAHLEVLALAKRPVKNANQPLHERLPLQLEGFEIEYLGLLQTQGTYLPGQKVNARFKRADLSAHQLLISPAGATDTQRLGYAAAWRLHLQQARAQAVGHRLALASAHFATTDKLLQLDSLRIQPQGPRQADQVQVELALQRLRLTGLDAAAVQHRHHLRADSLRLQTPTLNAQLPNQTPATGPAPALAFLRRLDLAHLQVADGSVRVSAKAQALKINELVLAGTSLQYDSATAPDASRVLFAKSWDLTLGRSQATVAAHALSLAGLRLSTQARTLALRSVQIRPPAPGQGKPGAARVALTMPSLTLVGLNAAALQHQRHFQADTLTIRDTKLNFTPPTQPTPPVWKLLSGFVRRSDLNRFVVKNTDLQIGGLRHSPEIYDLNLIGSSIRIDSLAAQTPARIAYARSWRASSGLVTAPFDPPYYRAASQRMRLDTDARTLVFTAMSLTPAYSAAQMNQRKGYQAAAISIKLSSLTARGLDFAALVGRNDFRIARITVQRPVVRIASDGRGPINPNYSKVSPEEMRKLPVLVDVRQLDIKEGNLYSRYRSPLTPIVGTMSINRFNGSFYNLSNDPRRQTADTPLTGKATTYLQNRCRLDAQVSMYLLDPMGRHRVWGAFGPGPFAMLNAMTVPTRLVEFKRGNVRRLRFDLHADRQRVRGTTWTEYSGLQMTLLRFDKEEVEVEKSLLTRVKSKLVNFVVIRDQNPRKRRKFETGDMSSTREPRFSVFTLWRQGMVSGLFNNVGVPQKLAQKLSESKDEAPLPK